METVKYKLKSQPGVEVEVPASYAKSAEELVRTALETPMQFSDAVQCYPYLINPAIAARTHQLALAEVGQQGTLRLCDIVVLRVCVWGIEQMLKRGGGIIADRENARMMIQELAERVYGLEQMVG